MLGRAEGGATSSPTEREREREENRKSKSVSDTFKILTLYRPDCFCCKYSLFLRVVLFI